jgi:hypothetical protein
MHAVALLIIFAYQVLVTFSSSNYLYYQAYEDNMGFYTGIFCTVKKFSYYFTLAL